MSETWDHHMINYVNHVADHPSTQNVPHDIALDMMVMTHAIGNQYIIHSGDAITFPAVIGVNTFIAYKTW